MTPVSQRPGTSAWLPQPPTRRIFALDALRGFAVLGLLVANIFLFAYPTARATSLNAWSGLDAVLRVTVALLVEGKFYTMFSVLFGLGLSMQRERAAAAGRPFTAFWIRRMFVLALFGLAHGLLFFPGDILLFYALVGLAALPLVSLPRRALAGVAAASFTVGVVLVGAHAALYPESPSPGPPDWPALASAATDEVAVPESLWSAWLADLDPELLLFMAEEERIASRGSWGEQLRFQAVSFFLVNMPLRLLFTFWWTLAFFLLGIGLGRHFDPGSPIPTSLHTSTAILTLFLIGLFLQVAGSGVSGSGHSLPVALGLALALSGALLVAASYAAGVIGLSARPRLRAVLRPLAATGRMSLTNYVGQSVVCSAIFSAWGLGLFDRLSLPKVLSIVPIVFLLQVLASSLWLSRFRYGPLEWLWRSASYGFRSPMATSRSSVRR